jgi:hypothetical protein
MAPDPGGTNLNARPKSDRDIDQLYGGPLDQFTAERNALAKRLRADGDKAAADEVSRLSKPTAAASLVNQLAHHHRKELDRFLTAADDLQGAQDEAISGGGGERLRQATRSAREAINRLLALARSEHGDATEVTLNRVGETLEAALTDPGVRRLVETGRVEREFRPGVVPSSPQPVGRAKKNVGSQKEAQIAAAQRELDEASDRLEAAERSEAEREETKSDAEQRLKEARTDLSSARKTTQQLRRQVNTAKKKLDRARRKK